MTLYTVGIWVVKPGHEDAFVRAWREMADWTMREVVGETAEGQGGKLLRDREEPHRFISFGPWESLEAIEAWRAQPGFQDRVRRMQEMLEQLTPMTLDDVSAQ